MNILILSWRDHLHPLAGGAEQVMREHIRGWIKAGHKVTLFSSRFIGCHEEEKSEGMEIFHKGDQYIGVKIFAFKFWLLNHKKYDLVIDQFHGIPFFTPIYVNKPKLAVLQEVAREVWFLNGFPFPINYFIGIIGFLIEPFIFLLYRNISFMVGSQSAKNDLIKMNIPKQNINIVPHGVILPKLKVIAEKPKTKTIVFLGTLAKDKGIEDVIKCFSVLDKQGKYNFWIIGKGPLNYKRYLKKMSAKLVKRNKITFWGFVNQGKKFALLSKAHVLLNPSIREGWGLVNIEANSVGTPVIAYKSAGLTDSVKESVSGIFCESNNYKNMAKITFDLLSNPDLYKRLTIGAVKWSKRFDWKISRAKSLELIQSIKK